MGDRWTPGDLRPGARSRGRWVRQRLRSGALAAGLARRPPTALVRRSGAAVRGGLSRQVRTPFPGVGGPGGLASDVYDDSEERRLRSRLGAPTERPHPPPGHRHPPRGDPNGPSFTGTRLIQIRGNSADELGASLSPGRIRSTGPNGSNCRRSRARGSQPQSRPSTSRPSSSSAASDTDSAPRCARRLRGRR